MIAKLLIEKTNNTYIQLFRYTAVGGVAFLFDVGSLYFFTEYFHVYYLISAGMAFVIGLTINYLISVQWVFEKHSLRSNRVEFLVFALIGLVGLALNELLMWFITEIVRTHYLYSKLVSTALVYLWNFFARKTILFR
jgi:putative flippase GtrA